MDLFTFFLLHFKLLVWSRNNLTDIYVFSVSTLQNCTSHTQQKINIKMAPMQVVGAFNVDNADIFLNNLKKKSVDNVILTLFWVAYGFNKL